MKLGSDRISFGIPSQAGKKAKPKLIYTPNLSRQLDIKSYCYREAMRSSPTKNNLSCRANMKDRRIKLAKIILINFFSTQEPSLCTRLSINLVQPI